MEISKEKQIIKQEYNACRYVVWQNYKSLLQVFFIELQTVAFFDVPKLKNYLIRISKFCHTTYLEASFNYILPKLQMNWFRIEWQDQLEHYTSPFVEQWMNSNNLITYPQLQLSKSRPYLGRERLKLWINFAKCISVVTIKACWVFSLKI